MVYYHVYWTRDILRSRLSEISLRVLCPPGPPGSRKCHQSEGTTWDWRWNTQHQFSAELKIALSESESFIWIFFQFSAELRGTRWTKWNFHWKWKFYHTSDLLGDFCGEYQCLTRSWGRKYLYDDSINQDIQAFSCSKRTTNKHQSNVYFVF